MFFFNPVYSNSNGFSPFGDITLPASVHVAPVDFVLYHSIYLYTPELSSSYLALTFISCPALDTSSILAVGFPVSTFTVSSAALSDMFPALSIVHAVILLSPAFFISIVTVVPSISLSVICVAPSTLYLIFQGPDNVSLPASYCDCSSIFSIPYSIP